MSIRVNPTIIPDMIAGLSQTQQQLNQADQQIASGRTINQPSDNPAGMAALILNHGVQSRTDTFSTNVSNLQDRLQTADSALSSAITAVNQAISLGVEAGNSTLSNIDRQAIVSQLSGIQQQLVSLANTAYGVRICSEARSWKLLPSLSIRPLRTASPTAETAQRCLWKSMTGRPLRPMFRAISSS